MNKIELLFTGNSSSAVKAARETEAAVGRVGESAKASSSGLSSAFAGASKGALALTKAFAPLVLALGTVEFAKGAIEGAENLRKAQESLAAAIEHTGGNAAQLVGSYAATAKAAAQFGINQTEATQALAKATLLTGDAARAQRAYTEAVLISKATGRDLNSVLTATAKGQDGITTSLRRYGILVSKTETGQQQLNQVMKTFGGQAAANTSQADKLRANFENLQTTLGTALLPAFNKIVTALNRVVVFLESPAVAKAAKLFAGVFVNIFKQLDSVVDAFVDAFHGNWGNLWSDVQAIVVGSFRNIFGFLAAVGARLAPIAVWLGETMANGIVSGMNGVGSAIAGIMQGAINVVIAAINAMISKVNSVKWGSVDTHIPGVGKIGGFGGLGIGKIGGVSGLGAAVNVSAPFSPGALPSFNLPGIGGLNFGGGGSGLGSGLPTGSGLPDPGVGTGAGGGTKTTPNAKIPAAWAHALAVFRDNMTKAQLMVLKDQEDATIKAIEAETGVQDKTGAIDRVKAAYQSAAGKLQAKISAQQLKAAHATIAEIEKAATGAAATLALAQAAGKPAQVILVDQQRLLADYQKEAAELSARVAASSGKAKTAYQTALTTIREKVQSTHDAVVSSLQGLAQTAAASLQTVIGQVQQAADLALGQQFFQGGLQTPSEAKLAAMQSEDTRQALAQALTDAQAQLESDLSAQADAATIAQDKEAADQAQRAIDENNLAIQATAERAQADKDFATAEFNLNAQIDGLSKNVGDGSDVFASLNVLLAGFGINLSALTDAGGTGLLSQLTSAISDTVSAFQALTAALGGKVTPAGAGAAAAGSLAAAFGLSPGAAARAGIGSGGATFTIPGFATGGIVTMPTLAMIGEAGPEAVIPLDRYGGKGVTISFAGANIYGAPTRQILDSWAAGIASALERRGTGMAIAR